MANPSWSRRRDAASNRRRRHRPSTIEPLEARELLAAGAFGINVELDPYASFVNELQLTGRWYEYDTETAISDSALNSSGDPQGDASLILDYRVNRPWNGPDPNAVAPDLSGTYHLSFLGQATINNSFPETTTPFTVQNQAYNPSTNTTTADLVVPAGNTQDLFVISFLNTQATGLSPSGVGTGFSDAKLIRPGYAADSTQVYTNEFIDALKPYSVLRYLDPDNANGQPFFDGNTLVTVDASQVDQTGTPWEILVALANQSDTDMWINVPEGATDAYVAALAGIIQNGGTVNGVTYAGLNPNLKVYLEYSNEVWGGVGFNEYYQIAAVQNEADNQPLSTFPSNLHVYDNVDGSTTTDSNIAVGRRYLERTADIGRIFQSVMGADPTHQRIRPVLGWQENDTDFYPAALDWYQHFFGPASAAFYGMGNANYFSPTDYSSVDAVINSLVAQEPAAIASAIQYTTIATSYGLKNVSYEGGPAIGASPSSPDGQVALAASRDPRMEQIVDQYYLDYYAAGGNLAEYFNGPFAIWSPQFIWSDAELSEYLDPSASPKYRGTQDIADAAPVAATAGIAVASSGSTSFDATTDTLGNSFFLPSTGQQGDWLLNVASAGTYDLKLSTGYVGGSAPGQVQVLLDGKAVGGVIDVSASSAIDLGDLALSSGLNAISLLVIHGSNDPGQGDGSFYQFEPSTFALTAVAGATLRLLDDGFEAVNVGGGFAYNPAGSAWAFSGTPGNGSGVTGNNSPFTSGNPVAPQGNQVAFLQANGTITQSLAGWAAGDDTLTFQAAQRGNHGTSVEDFEVLVDGNVVGTFQPSGTAYQTYTTRTFAVSAGAHTIKFLGLDSAGGDNTAFLDSVTITASTSAINPGAPTVGDGGFEAIPIGPANYAYNPTGSAWTFSGTPGNGSGVTGNKSGFTSGNPNAPDGTQVAFLQGNGTIVQSVAGWAAGNYTISFEAAQRGNHGTSEEDFEILIDGNVVGTFQPSGTAYQTYTTGTFAVSSGPHTVEFLGLDSAGGDNTAFLDAVTVATSLSAATSSAPTSGDPGFEAIPIGPGTYAYNPTGSSWAFSGSPGNGSGVTGNNSPFTSGNPVAPQGSQVAFLQADGTITQTVAGWAAGNYTISFAAARRGNHGGLEDFEVLVDDNVVGTFQPSGTAYQTYTTGTFAVSSGAHTVEFLGLDSAGGDNTDFLDAVSIATA